MKLLPYFAALLFLLLPARSESKTTAEFEMTVKSLNEIVIKRNGKAIAINAAPSGVEVDRLFLTHARRDVISAAERSAPPEKWAVSPAIAEVIQNAEEHWQKWWDARFNYYQQQVTRLPLKNHIPGTVMEPGVPLKWQGLTITMIPTPGYTRDGTSYLVDFGKRKVLYTGDLILKGGKVRDLYSFQNEIKEAKVGGYHGYMGRISTWLQSIQTIRSLGVDAIVPSRGETIDDPGKDLAASEDLAKSIYRSYLSTNALHWYFGEERMGTSAELVLGKDHGVKGMPFAEHIDLPDWCQHISTTKLLVSEDGSGFALDVGGPNQLESLRKALADGLVKSIDGIFATHTHNDHSAAIGEAAREFGCPVYALPEVADVLENPGHWFLPGISPNPVDKVAVKQNGETMQWKEFNLTFHFYPGQMYNHGALLVEKADHDPVFFIGDSFSPSGIDDYCLMNRNLMRDDTGYALCFRKIEGLPKETWLVNQHIPHLFRFSDDERSFLKTNYRKRKDLIGSFVAWDDPNFGIDEQWAKFYPYGQEANPGEKVKVSLEIWNHSDVERTFTLRLNDHIGSTFSPATLIIPARETASKDFQITIPEDAAERVHLITADITRDDGVHLPEWCEALIKVAP